MRKEGPSILQRLLEAGYRSYDPQSAFSGVAVTKTLLDQLIPPDLPTTGFPPTLCKDLTGYLAQKEKKWDDDALKCQFIYFATSMVHVFHNEKCAVAYIQPNVAIPYIWLNVIDDKTFELVNFCSRIEKDIFRVIIHIVRSVDQIDTVKKSIHLRNGGLVMPFSAGNAIQLTLRLDLEQPILSMNAANPTLPNCVVLLSYKGQFCGAWHKGKEKLTCAVH